MSVARGVILIVDDHPLVGQALQATIGGAFTDLEVIVVSSMSQADAYAQEAGARVRLVLLDLMLPDTRGFDALLRLGERLPGAPIAIMSARADSHTVAMAAAFGAAGFVDKAAPIQAFVDAAKALLRGETALPEAPAAPPEATDLARRLRTLSRSQLRVLTALAGAASNREIGAEMNLTEGTVKQHVSAILRKLDVRNRSQAILAAQAFVQLAQPPQGRDGDKPG